MQLAIRFSQSKSWPGIGILRRFGDVRLQHCISPNLKLQVVGDPGRQRRALRRTRRKKCRADEDVACDGGLSDVLAGGILNVNQEAYPARLHEPAGKGVEDVIPGDR